MDAFVQSLLERLPEEKRQQMLGLVNRAIQEVKDGGIMSRLSPELKKQVNHPDPRVSMKVRTQLAKSVGVQNIPTSQPIPLKNGAAAHMIIMEYNPQFYHAEALCVQGGLEGLYLSGMPKKCENNVMEYYINLRNSEQEAMPLLKELALVQGMYENFRIHVTVSVETGFREVPLPQPETEEKAPRRGIFARLFGKKSASAVQ